MAVTLNATTLAAAMTADQGVVNLASGATVLVGHLIYVDREAMQVLAPVAQSTTAFYVSRGINGTAAVAHITAAKAKTGSPHYFYLTNVSGAASAATEVALPHINVTTGDVFDIATGAWNQVGTGGVIQATAVWP